MTSTVILIQAGKNGKLPCSQVFISFSEDAFTHSDFWDTVYHITLHSIYWYLDILKVDNSLKNISDGNMA